MCEIFKTKDLAARTGLLSIIPHRSATPDTQPTVDAINSLDSTFPKRQAEQGAFFSRYRIRSSTQPVTNSISHEDHAKQAVVALTKNSAEFKFSPIQTP